MGWSPLSYLALYKPTAATDAYMLCNYDLMGLRTRNRMYNKHDLISHDFLIDPHELELCKCLDVQTTRSFHIQK